jgi:hypothetical protein
VQPFSRRVLDVFREMGRDRLDLHTLFEAGGNEPLYRVRVLDAVESLVDEGILEAAGGDFYSLTPKGKSLVGS